GLRSEAPFGLKVCLDLIQPGGNARPLFRGFWQSAILKARLLRLVRFCPQRGFEILPLEAAVGFEMAAFGPFIPGVDEDKSLLAGEVFSRPSNGFLQPVLIICRRAVQSDKGARPDPCSLVP